MVSSSKAVSGSARAQLTRLAERRAFESFLRHGRSPVLEAKLAAERDVSLRMLGDGRPTRFYTWRTSRDERVRSTHHALEGRVFAWDKPSPHGHPGDEERCRCWPEPYYGSPLALGAPVSLTREVLTDKAGRKVWSSVEIATRPDGSLASSNVALRTGTRIASTFAGSVIVNKVRLSDGRSVRLERRDGISSVFLGEGVTPSYQFAWGNDGPKVPAARTHVAQLLRVPGIVPVIPGGPKSDVDLVDPAFFDDYFRRLDAIDEHVRGLPIESYIGFALIELFNAITGAPALFGAGDGEVAAVSFRAWKDPKKGLTSLVTGVTTLTAAQAAQSCKILPQAQQWTNEAATALLPRKGTLSAQDWGIQVHLAVETRVKALKEQVPLVYGNIYAELSIAKDGDPAKRGALGSTRLDIFEEVRPGVACVYDIKTGRGLTPSRVDSIADRVATRYPGWTIIVIEIRPFE